MAWLYSDAVRVCFFIQRLEVGFGVAVAVAETARRLMERGVEVVIYTTSTRGIDLPGVEVRTLAIPGGNTNRLLPLYQWRTDRLLRGMVGELGEFDWVVLASFPFYSLAPILYEERIGGHPRTLWWEFGLPPSMGFSLGGKMNWWWLRRTLNRQVLAADRVVTISRFLRGALPEKARWGALDIPLGGDHLPLTLGSQLTGRVLELGEDAFVCLSVARLSPRHHPYKGLRELVRAYRQVRKTHPRTRLVLAGRVESKEELAGWSEGAVVVENPTPAELAALYWRADLYVTMSRWEGFNLPILEAGYQETPALAYEIGAHRENVTRFLVEPEEYLMVERWRELADLGEVIREEGKRVRERALVFTWSKTARGLLHVMQGEE